MSCSHHSHRSLFYLLAIFLLSLSSLTLLVLTVFLPSSTSSSLFTSLPTPSSTTTLSLSFDTYSFSDGIGSGGISRDTSCELLDSDGSILSNIPQCNLFNTIRIFHFVLILSSLGTFLLSVKLLFVPSSYSSCISLFWSSLFNILLSILSFLFTLIFISNILSDYQMVSNATEFFTTEYKLYNFIHFISLFIFLLSALTSTALSLPLLSFAHPHLSSSSQSTSSLYAIPYGDSHSNPTSRKSQLTMKLEQLEIHEMRQEEKKAKEEEKRKKKMEKEKSKEKSKSNGKKTPSIIVTPPASSSPTPSGTIKLVLIPKSPRNNIQLTMRSQVATPIRRQSVSSGALSPSSVAGSRRGSVEHRKRADSQSGRRLSIPLSNLSSPTNHNYSTAKTYLEDDDIPLPPPPPMDEIDEINHISHYENDEKKSSYLNVHSNDVSPLQSSRRRLSSESNGHPNAVSNSRSPSFGSPLSTYRGNGAEEKDGGNSSGEKQKYQYMTHSAMNTMNAVNDNDGDNDHENGVQITINHHDLDDNILSPPSRPPPPPPSASPGPVSFSSFSPSISSWSNHSRASRPLLSPTGNDNDHHDVIANNNKKYGNGAGGSRRGSNTSIPLPLPSSSSSTAATLSSSSSSSTPYTLSNASSTNISPYSTGNVSPSAMAMTREGTGGGGLMSPSASKNSMDGTRSMSGKGSKKTTPNLSRGKRVSFIQGGSQGHGVDNDQMV